MKKYLLLLILPILTYASIGKITVVKGDVKVQRDGETIQAKSGTVLEKNDFIKTNKVGKVQIIFSDNTIFTVGKNSTLDIADYLYDEAQPKNNKAQFNVLKGAFSSITGRIGKLNKSKFKLKTKSASIGIRGTIVKANQETIMCTEGAITVTTNNGIAVRVEAGYQTNVSTDTPTQPETIKANDEQTMDVDVAPVATSSVQNITQEVETQTQAVDTDTQNEIATETRTITLDGRTIDKDGNQQYLTIEAEGVGDQLTIDGQDAIVTNDSGEAITNIEDETISWGHWADDPSKKWVSGQKTDVKVLNELRDASKSVKNPYNGQVMGTVNGTDDIKMDSTNQVQIDVELGDGKNSVDGTIVFETKAGQTWNSEFSGTTEGTTFQEDTLSGKGGQGGTNTITSGSVDGQFYGQNAEAVGGTFDLQAGKDRATGVFKATK
ncbi:MAG: FecR domain-containing protein [Campylobacterota bacterium]|nr:FecR domain-containing protein [Campylobacterota bacterium]